MYPLALARCMRSGTDVGNQIRAPARAAACAAPCAQCVRPHASAACAARIAALVGCAVQHSRWAARAPLPARQATLGSTPRTRARARPQSRTGRTAEWWRTRTTRMGATGTLSPAAPTTTRTRPARPACLRNRCAPVRPGACTPPSAAHPPVRSRVARIDASGRCGGIGAHVQPCRRYACTVHRACSAAAMRGAA